VARPAGAVVVAAAAAEVPRGGGSPFGRVGQRGARDDAGEEHGGSTVGGAGGEWGRLVGSAGLGHRDGRRGRRWGWLSLVVMMAVGRVPRGGGVGAGARPA
jgi:hypothetical protein